MAKKNAPQYSPENEYIRKWVPEFETSDYPEPIIDLAASRDRCLRVYKQALKE